VDSQAWDRRYAGTELVWTSEPNRFLVAEAAALEPGRALDLACGEGRNAVWLAEHGWQVTGVDFSAVGLGKAAALARSQRVQADWIAADLLEWEPARAAFALVIVFYLQVPASERGTIVGRAAGAVAVGGTFLLVGHDSAISSTAMAGRRFRAFCTRRATSSTIYADRALRSSGRSASSDRCRPPTPCGSLSTRSCAPRGRPENAPCNS
jgi:SAM-dependent methyltransferase